MKRIHEPETLAFCNSFKIVLLSSNKSARQIGKEIGCGHATLSRIAAGYAPDIDSYFRIKRWMKKQGDALALLEDMVSRAKEEISNE